MPASILEMHESDQMDRRILKAGALAYVLKSDLTAQLVRAVREVSKEKLFLTPKVTGIVVRGFLKTEWESAACGQEVITTPRETEIVRLLVGGKSNKEIFISESVRMESRLEGLFLR